MNHSLSLAAAAQPTPRLPLPLLMALRAAVFESIAPLRGGQLLVRDPDGSETRLGAPEGPCHRVSVRDWSFYAYSAFGGTTGVGQAWILGLWDTAELVDVCRLFLREDQVLGAMDGGLSRLRAPLYRLMEWRRRNTRNGSRRNIAAHYDLGNDFFRLFLDEGLTYSAGLFADDTTTLADAQHAKYEAICRRLNLQPGQRLIEIGSGWGGFALHAARHHGATVTTTTISREQFELACQRVRAAGLDGQVTVRLSDYRELTGRYDRLVSIEMIEAVGHDFLPVYFRKLDELLAPDGEAVIQAITIQDRHYQRMRQGTDFIRQFIFPGGHLPCVQEMLRVTARHTALQLFGLEDFGQDYARTLQLWRAAYHRQLHRVAELGYGPEFRRMWDFYLASCEAGFREARTSVVHAHFTKPGCRRESMHYGSAT